MRPSNLQVFARILLLCSFSALVSPAMADEDGDYDQLVELFLEFRDMTGTGQGDFGEAVLVVDAQ